jgi:propanol-preferring alcohol dehydrogenase
LKPRPRNKGASESATTAEANPQPLKITMSSPTYRAIQATEPRKLELVERTVTEPPPGKVRIRVEACGVCHSDAATVEGVFPGLTFPRVPGHEVVGKIDALGEGVLDWKIGQRVGVGFLGGHCGQCKPCRRGDFVNCQRQPVSGISYDGGYAEVMIASQTGLVAIPEELSSADAAPLLCAGLTTYNALRNSPARSGDLVVIQGIGGLGHLGVQYAARMGFQVVAVARGAEKAALAKQLGAHHYIDSKVEDPVARLQALGGANLILATASDSKSMSALVGALAPRGRMIVVGVGSDPLTVTPAQLLFGSKSIEGALTGSSLDNEDTLAFSVLERIRPMIETVPLEKAAEAYGRMLRNEARFRMVLLTGQ